MSKILKLALYLCLLSLANSSLAQQIATVSGVIKAEPRLMEDTRLGVHLLNANTQQLEEIASVTPVAGTFSVSAVTPPPSSLSPWRDGTIVLPGLINEYSVTPAGVMAVRAVTNTYVDSDQNGHFDGHHIDPLYLGIASVESPGGFFSLVYTQEDAVISGKGQSLAFRAGWNIYTVRFTESGEALYSTQPVVTDVVLDVFFPTNE